MPSSHPRKALRGGIQKSILTDFLGNVGDSRQMLTKIGQTAPRTGTEYPHEGPFVVSVFACPPQRALARFVFSWCTGKKFTRGS